MNRRNFMTLSLSAVAVLSLPTSSFATNFREERPGVWDAKNIDDAILSMYGTNSTIEQSVSLQIPSIAANGTSVPVKISSNIQANSVTLFQSANPESTVIAFDINEYSIIDYDLKMKMKQSGNVVAIVEGLDGKLYMAQQYVQVAEGGCDP